MEMEKKKENLAAFLRWGILLRALLSTPPSPSQSDDSYQVGLKRISRKTVGGFNLISCHPLDDHLSEDFYNSLKRKNLAGPKDVYFCYELPVTGASKLIMMANVRRLCFSRSSVHFAKGRRSALSWMTLWSLLDMILTPLD